jgi:hypothetical protein
MRESFADLGERLALGAEDVSEQAAEMLRVLNANYRTRHTLDQLPIAADIVVMNIPKAAWDARLTDLSEEEAQEFGEMVPAMIRKIYQAVTQKFGNKGARRPYSLLTKYLHFLMPDLFVIYDAQAAMSIRMWSLFALGHENPASRRFDWLHLADSTGKGYGEIVSFYRLAWEFSGEQERKGLEGAARNLQAMMRDHADLTRPRVTPLDLIDKHLWHGNGDPIRLGLADPP